MKLELGKKYLTRDGRKARVICVDKLGSRPVVVLIQEGSVESSIEYYKDWRFYPGSEDCLDLVSEYHEPLKLEFWAMTLGDYRPASFLTICGQDLTIHSEKPIPQNCQKLFRITALEVRDES